VRRGWKNNFLAAKLFGEHGLLGSLGCRRNLLRIMDFWGDLGFFKLREEDRDFANHAIGF
jgi:hypothetical protein